MVKISDIAREMNLSEATVSNAMTGGGRMKEETRAAILRCADELGYVPAKRSRKRARRNLIVIAEDLRNSFVDRMLEGIRVEAATEKLHLPIYHLGLRTKSLRNPDVESLNKAAAPLFSTGEAPISGAIFVAQYPRLIEGLFPELHAPVVSVFCTRENGLPTVNYDDRYGAYLAIKSLIESGRRNIAMISGPIDSVGMIFRTNGYQRALVDHGLHFDPSLMRIGDWSMISSYQVTRALLAEDRKIDSIFAQNDMMAVGAMYAIAEKGLSVPRDIAVIGFDNSVLCHECLPFLSSVEPDFEEMGRTSLRLLLQALKKKGGPVENAVVSCKLIHRDSTDNLPSL